MRVAIGVALIRLAMRVLGVRPYRLEDGSLEYHFVHEEVQ